MFQSLLALVILFLTSQSVLSDKFQDIAIACYKENGYDGRPMDFSDPAIPNEVKCSIACIIERNGGFKEDGSIDQAKHIQDAKETIKEIDALNKFIKATEECDPKARANKCETAYEFTKCINQKVM